MNCEIYKKKDIIYMNKAIKCSKLSYCKNKKVGAIIVKNNRIISDGYNGTPSGFDNICEDQNGNTKWYVLHAEANAILKMAFSSKSCKDSYLYITHSPCKECSKLIHQSKIKRVVYLHKYSEKNDGLNFLKKSKIIIHKLIY
ncbi:deoxycytidylate deaminase [Blattabacterium punctulatus]|uniref:deoxycytidylate deaminase n=1 Tax=Blattabacterium punctulatus TaxID=164514 RepID=UPI000D7C94AE|nr:deaminase [Blattabacterium punctulatus]AWU44993.1 dCMP deaminase [Blattabacterium punctulatus]